MSSLDSEFSRGTFETGSFGARFKICFDHERPALPVCFDVGAQEVGVHDAREFYVACYLAGQPAADPSSMKRISTETNWTGTVEKLRWLRRQSPYTIRAWLRENGFEPFIDEQISAARAE